MVLSVIVFLATLGFPEQPGQKIGPGFMPQAVAICLFISSFVLLCQNLFHRDKAPQVRIESINWPVLSGNIGIWMGLIGLTYLFGFIPSFGLLLLFYQFFYGDGRKNVIKAIIIAAGSVLIVYLFMIVVLKIPLPEAWVAF